jgi:polysaccharide pyruvyl transferase WcaK-like protein
VTPLRILHIASFSGNVGDNANHIGFRSWLQELTDRTIVWTEIEIRQFFWRERAWDADLVDHMNSFDAVVIGGGNYFELWVENSPTGTSIAIEPALWARIRVPVFFNALGVDPGQGVPEHCRQRFTAFLDTLLGDDSMLVSVRNDGARKNMADHIGQTQADAVLHAPDNGFFANFTSAHEIALFSDPQVKRYVTFNLASDMAEIRFAGFKTGIDGFVDEVARAIIDLSERDQTIGILFAPHIFRDLDIANRVINRLPDRLRRTRIAQAPYGSGDAAARAIFSMYAASDVCVGTRFHANVVPIGNLRQTLGLACYPQILALYEEVGQPDRCVDVSVPGFADVLAERVSDALFNPETAFSGTPQQAFETAKSLRNSIAPSVATWLSRG